MLDQLALGYSEMRSGSVQGMELNQIRALILSARIWLEIFENRDEKDISKRQSLGVFKTRALAEREPGGCPGEARGKRSPCPGVIQLDTARAIRPGRAAGIASAIRSRR